MQVIIIALDYDSFVIVVVVVATVDVVVVTQDLDAVMVIARLWRRAAPYPNFSELKQRIQWVPPLQIVSQSFVSYTLHDPPCPSPPSSRIHVRHQTEASLKGLVEEVRERCCYTEI